MLKISLSILTFLSLIPRVFAMESSRISFDSLSYELKRYIFTYAAYNAPKTLGRLLLVNKDFHKNLKPPGETASIAALEHERFEDKKRNARADEIMASFPEKLGTMGTSFLCFDLKILISHQEERTDEKLHNVLLRKFTNILPDYMTPHISSLIIASGVFTDLSPLSDAILKEKEWRIQIITFIDCPKISEESILDLSKALKDTKVTLDHKNYRNGEYKNPAALD